MDENPYQSQADSPYWHLPSRLSQERIVLGVYAVATFAAFLGLVLLHFRDSSGLN